MSSQNKRYIFQQAEPSDSSEILEILEEQEFSGKIALTYTRRPDPIKSFLAEGSEVDILISRDLKKNKITSVAVVSFNPLFINGTEHMTGYLFGLRVRKEYRRRYSILPVGYRMLFDRHPECRLFFTTILEENEMARRLLEKKRPYMPIYHDIGGYRVLAIKTGGTSKIPDGYSVEKARREDASELVAFLQKEGPRHNLFPVVTEDMLVSEHAVAPVESFYLLRDNNGALAACASAWDQQERKQYIVDHYLGIYRFLQPVSPFLFPLFGYPALPAEGSTLNFYTLSFYLSKDGNTDLMQTLIEAIGQREKGYNYFLVGIHEKSALFATLSKKRHIVYKSRSYLVYEEPHADEAHKFDHSLTPYLECGRL